MLLRSRDLAQLRPKIVPIELVFCRKRFQLSSTHSSKCAARAVRLRHYRCETSRPTKMYLPPKTQPYRNIPRSRSIHRIRQPSRSAQCETKENDKDTGKHHRCKHWFPSGRQPIGPDQNLSERHSPRFVVWIDRRRSTRREGQLPTASGDTGPS